VDSSYDPATASRQRLSWYALLAANLAPLIGVFVFGWEARDLLVLYWAENLVVGMYAVLRMATAPGPTKAKVLLIPFFILHFGTFTAVHGAFVGFLAFGPMSVSSSLDPATSFWAGLTAVVVPFLGLVLSHGVSFVTNYLLGGERQRTNVAFEMFRPYGRVVVMHVTLLVGFCLVFAVSAMGVYPGVASRYVPTLVLIALKTVIDTKFHRRSHAKLVAQLTPIT
jgi:hypothetical protein